MTKIIGDEELKRKLRSLSDLRFLRPAIKAGVDHISGKVSIYPDETGANDSSRRRWYQRGWGTRYRRRDGSLGGKQKSEDLGLSWLGDAKVVSHTRGIIGNDASYAKFVQGGQDQSSVMRNIGWKTTDDIAEEESAKVLEFVQKAVERELSK